MQMKEDAGNNLFPYPALMTCREAVKVTGLSYEYLLNGCKDGTIPCIRCGRTFKIKIYRYLEMLDAQPTAV